ncbi:universal stress protein [Seonamhaeicola aphaedonensis]|uniref:Nucleotide-binding universal stress UspA family protein n=1 Tax=Seonamhaeicola aphaedonensis TaxID=1461338 RepID=A0A3D9HH10_9FLAO|nr:universal stress protein [Seonamhaeicola aphaedonensis]RED48760.1 nucleotide-binding universal stress UspA family protein [Seonamhaeicola aphaedonensis]
MKNKAYKILVLSDLKNSSDTIMKTTANLAKMIGGDIDLLHVKKPVDVVKNENQLSSMRNINRDYIKSRNHIEDVIKSVDKDLNISYSLTYGNIKQIIEEHIDKTNPDIIVLGKRRFNSLKLVGDKLTRFILKKHNGLVLVASNKYVLKYDENISLGVLNNTEQPFENLAKELMEISQKPIKSFKITKANESEFESKESEFKKLIEYVFEPNDNVLSNLSKYMTKSNIDLLCVNRHTTASNKLGNLDLDGVLNKMNTSIMFAGK